MPPSEEAHHIVERVRLRQLRRVDVESYGEPLGRHSNSRRGPRSVSTKSVEILFRALDRPEHVANLLSLELTGAWVNEAREMPWAVISALKGRVDRYPARNEGGCVDPGIIMDTNPPEDDSWWYKLFEERGDEADTRSVEIFRQPSGRSPEAENLSSFIAEFTMPIWQPAWTRTLSASMWTACMAT
jgi:hypothetical protein